MPQLHLWRKRGQEIVIGENITVRVVQISGKNVRLVIDAPLDVPVMRKEILDRDATDTTTDATEERRPC